jgi:5S rRNA maturation endonuclease (ribonuclease M5)
MDTKERLELLEHLFEQLRLKNLEIPVLVEGKRDREALKNLGLEGEILIVNTGHTLMEMCEDLGHRYTEIILMLDWDKKGKELSKNIEHNLVQLGIKTDRAFMVRIFHLVSKETKEVEALDKLMERLNVPAGMDQNRLGIWNR